MTREQAHATGAWHRSIHCLILRPVDAGFILFQRRSPMMAEFPDVLDVTVSGHYQAGEVTEETLHRELKEELRIDVTLADVWPLGITIDLARRPELIHREFCDVFLLPRQEEMRAYAPCSAEVAGLVEFPINAGLRLFAGEETYIPATALVRKDDTWSLTAQDLHREDFHPRVTPYYMSILIAARRFLDGERYIVV